MKKLTAVSYWYNQKTDRQRKVLRIAMAILCLLPIVGWFIIAPILIPLALYLEFNIDKTIPVNNPPARELQKSQLLFNPKGEPIIDHISTRKSIVMPTVRIQGYHFNISDDWMFETPEYEKEHIVNFKEPNMCRLRLIRLQLLLEIDTHIDWTNVNNSTSLGKIEPYIESGNWRQQGLAEWDIRFYSEGNYKVKLIKKSLTEFSSALIPEKWFIDDIEKALNQVANEIRLIVQSLLKEADMESINFNLMVTSPNPSRIKEGKSTKSNSYICYPN